MGDGLIFSKPTNGPALHAFVVGVGYYPYLPGGDFGKKKTSYHNGMRQTPSAALSAQAMCKWLLDPARGYCDPNRPLASVRLLLSEARPAEVDLGLAKKVLPEAATMANFKLAARAWKAALNVNEDDLAIFFFSGHGVATGFEQSLLLSDFGADDDSISEYILRFSMFHEGMDRAAARDQIFFVDACRGYAPKLNTIFGTTGQPVIDPGADPGTRSRLRKKPLFNATVAGGNAYALNNKPSFFTQALLEALEGSGGSNLDDELVWRLNTHTIGEALEYRLKLQVERQKLKLAPQVNTCNDMQHLLFGQLNSLPRVRLGAKCIPENVNKSVHYVCGDIKWKPVDGPQLVEVGLKTVVAHVSPSLTVPRECYVQPPYKNITIKVPSS